MIEPDLRTFRPEGGEIPTPVKLAVLISNKGSGTNLQAIIDAIGRGDLKAQIDLVVSDKANAKGLERARNNNISEMIMELHDRKLRSLYSSTLARTLNQEGIQIAILAGFATILDASYFNVFSGVTINVHPGILHDENDKPILFPNGKEAPDNKGKLTDNAVSLFVPYGYAGSTIHVETVEADSGPVIERTEFIELTPEDLEDLGKFYDEKLKPAEHRALKRALANPKRIFEIAGKEFPQK